MNKLVLGLSIAALAAPCTLAFTEPTAFADVAAPSPTITLPLRLPHGIHLGRDGRYYQPVCNPAAPTHCLAQRLLPETFRPGDSAPEAAPGVSPALGAQICAGGGFPGGGASAPPAGAMAPSDVVAAYQIPAASRANGQVVAVVDMPDSNAYADLSTYRKAFGIPALPQCPNGLPDGTTPCFAIVDESGKPADPSLDCAASDPETALDTAMVSAACPDCSILVVEMTGGAMEQGPQPQDFVTATATAARLGAVATSISFGGPEQDGEPMGFTTPGHLVLAASGDYGYLLEGEGFGGAHTPSYPASAPDVLSVGGTLLQKGASAYSEVVWDDQQGATGSGCSTVFPMPSFQSQLGASKFGSCTKRASVDLSGAANFSPGGQGGGIASYDSHNQWWAMVGTSAASPLVAAILTRVGVAGKIANDLGWVYANGAAFHDVTSGTDDRDGLCQQGDVMCTAGPGWDGPTGMGTPNATELAGLAGTGLSAGTDAGSDPGEGADAGANMGAGADASTGASPGTGADAGSGAGGGSGASSGGSSDIDAGAPTPTSNSDTGTFGEGPAHGCACALAGAGGSTGGAAALGVAVALASLSLRRKRRA
jgi:hypothetical protein